MPFPTPSSRPIAVFDSGVGGLSVLREIRARLPRERLLYLADGAYAPYGERSLAEVRDRAEAIARRFIDEGAKVIVVACNSASAAALHHLRREFPEIPFVGMEPAVKPAAAVSQRGVIGVLATDATFQGELFESVVARHSNGSTVVAQAAPGLAAQVEAGHLDTAETKELLRRYLDPMVEAGIDTLVLGCTHYPFLLPIIRGVLGDGIAVIDPSPAVARQVGRVLDIRGLGAGGDALGSLEFLTTGDPVAFARNADALLGERIDAVAVEV